MKMAIIVRTVIAVFLAMVTLCACGPGGVGSDERFLVRVGKSRISVLDFHEAMEIRRSAYPHQGSISKMQLAHARKRLLDQMIEELLLLERARDLGLAVSEKELSKRVAAFKKEYPDNVFQEMLLENAISDHAWKEGIRKRLVMEKVIQAELETQLAITSEEVLEYYQQLAPGGDPGETDPAASPEISSGKVIQALRREKLEQAYLPYLDGLKKRYDIEVNLVLWEKISNS